MSQLPSPGKHFALRKCRCLSKGKDWSRKCLYFCLFYPEDKLELVSQEQQLDSCVATDLERDKGVVEMENCSAGRAVSGESRQDPSCLVTVGRGKQTEGTEDALRKLQIYRRNWERSRKQ